MPTVTVEKAVKLETIDCCACGIVFGIPEVYVNKRRQDHRTFYCPNGHSLVFEAETKEERQIRELRQQIAREQEIARRASENEMIQVEARVAAEKKLSRVSSGVCPCCNRTFKQLAAHMKSKHPDFVDKGSKTRLGLAARTGE